MIACPKYQTEILCKYGLDDKKRTFQKNEYFTVFPEDYFSPKSQVTRKIKITSNTYSIHHFTDTWNKKGVLFFKERERKLAEKIGKRKAKIIIKIFSFPYRVSQKILDSIRKKFRRRILNEKNRFNDLV